MINTLGFFDDPYDRYTSVSPSFDTLTLSPTSFSNTESPQFTFLDYLQKLSDGTAQNPQMENDFIVDILSDSGKKFKELEDLLKKPLNLETEVEHQHRTQALESDNFTERRMTYPTDRLSREGKFDGSMTCGSVPCTTAVSRFDDLLAKTLIRYMNKAIDFSIGVSLFEQEREPLSRLTQRYSQIESASFETQKMGPLAALQLAFFIEVQVKKIEVTANKFFLHKESNYYVQIDVRQFYIASREQFSTFSKDGAYKNIRSCLEVNLDTYALPNVVTLGRSKLDCNPEELVLIQREVDFLKRFKNTAGIIDLTSWGYLEEQGKKRTCIVMPYYEKNLQQAIQNDLIPLTTVFQIALQLLSGIAVVHSKGVVHGAIRQGNILFHKPQEAVVCSLIDFKFAFDHKKGEQPVLYMAYGYYGNIAYTALELFGVQSFQGDFFKLDVWALGCILYELVFKKRVPWALDIEYEYSQNFDRTDGKPYDERHLEKTQLRVQKLIEKTIEAPYEELMKKATLTFEEQIQQIVYLMLRVNPTHRISSHQALQQTFLLGLQQLQCIQYLQ